MKMNNNVKIKYRKICKRNVKRRRRRNNNNNEIIYLIMKWNVNNTRMKWKMKKLFFCFLCFLYFSYIMWKRNEKVVNNNGIIMKAENNENNEIIMSSYKHTLYTLKIKC